MSTRPELTGHRHYTPIRLASKLAESLAAEATNPLGETPTTPPNAPPTPSPRQTPEKDRFTARSRGSEPLWTQLWPRAPRVVLETLQSCDTCREAALTLARWCRRMDHPNPLVGCEAEIAPERLRELLALPHRQRLAEVQHEVDYWLWGLVMLLLEEGWSIRFSRREGYAELAELALAIFPRLDAAFYGAPRMADLQARVLTHIGNSRRKLHRYGSAEQALKDAEAIHLRGTGNPKILAEILLARASLERERDQLAQARALLTQAFSLFNRAGDEAGVLRAQVTLSTLLLDLCQPDAVLELLDGLHERLESPEVEPPVRLVAFYNLAYAAREVGNLESMEAAREHLPESDPLSRLLRGWIDGHLAARRGERDRAIVAYRRAKAGYLRLGRGWEAALISLDLIELLLEAGEEATAHAVAADLFEVLYDERLPRQAAQEVIRFSKLARTRTLSLASVEEFRTYLRRVQHEPELAWSGELPGEAPSAS